MIHDGGSASDDAGPGQPGAGGRLSRSARLMCFSATASFAASGIIAAVGVGTLVHVREPRAIPFASLPLLFALHQFTEGFVWLGLEGRIGPTATDHVVFLFLLYAKGILPLLIPFSVALMEPAGWRRGALSGLTLLGAALCAWIVYSVIAYPSSAGIEHHSIAYANAGTGSFAVAAGYVLTTCGALLLSSHRVVRWFGLLNLAGLTIVLLVKGYAFASVWCFYAALLSVILYWQFSSRAISVARPNERVAVPA
jgi:hypothetical protein